MSYGYLLAASPRPYIHSHTSSKHQWASSDSSLVSFPTPLQPGAIRSIPALFRLGADTYISGTSVLQGLQSGHRAVPLDRNTHTEQATYGAVYIAHQFATIQASVITNVPGFAIPHTYHGQIWRCHVEKAINRAVRSESVAASHRARPTPGTNRTSCLAAQPMQEYLCSCRPCQSRTVLFHSDTHRRY